LSRKEEKKGRVVPNRRG